MGKQTTTRGVAKSISREPKAKRQEVRKQAQVSTAHARCADCGKTSGVMTKQARGKRVVNLCVACTLAWQADRGSDYLKPMTASQRLEKDAQAQPAVQAPAAVAMERPTVITPRRPSVDDRAVMGMLGLLLRSAFTRSGDLLALAAPRLNAQMRPVRRQLALMVGESTRRIPSGPVMAMGPGDWESPYKPEEIERWHQKWLRELDETLRLSAAYATADGNMTGKEKHSLNWEMTNAVQRMQHASFILGNLLMAV